MPLAAAVAVELVLAVTVLCTLVVETPLELDAVAVTLDSIVVTLVTVVLDEADEAVAAEDEDTDDAEERIDESEDATDAVLLEAMDAEAVDESALRERDADERDAELEPEPVGRRDESEDGMADVVIGSVTEAVTLVAAELPTEEMMERGLVETMLSGSVTVAVAASEVEVRSSVEVVRRTPVAVRMSESVSWRR